MALFKGDTIKKVNKLLDNAEKRKTKLQDKITRLQEEKKAMQEAIQDDFNRAILEDLEPDKGLEKGLTDIVADLEKATFQLSQVDNVVANELAKAKQDVDKERKQFVSDKGEGFLDLYNKMNQAKLNYLNAVIEYSTKKQVYVSEYWKTFRDIEDRTGLRRHDPRDDFNLGLNRRYQSKEQYDPIIRPDEHRDALEGKLNMFTAYNVDKYK
ncbi:hypothetical protein GLV94_01950 [Virgibacillus halodenitrificans]|uniref:hypothetical protein n=1 Tax=Virgibacillus halodenitrificans TaxID=1482 RepID=UPI00136CD3B7|nr:hypothetical protein [Virgibacillus halodenitrificans]MYL44397.1 hypothetical protein [Virgibacillus halodenitrificans]